MPIDRYVITDRQWAKIESHCLILVGRVVTPARFSMPCSGVRA